MNAPDVSSEIVAHEIDAALRSAIARTFQQWGRRHFLPALRWSVEHWDGQVTLVGTAHPRWPGRRRLARRWAAALQMEPVSDHASRWFLRADGWHLEIHG